MEPSYKYAGFISYRHSDRQSLIARALQRGLSRYAKPFWQIRATRLFRDETNLSAHPDLFGRIIEALDSSQNLLLMASPDAASSVWVEKELAHWLERRRQKGLILILTDGNLSWDERVGRFNRSETTALPASLLERFDTEPLYVDLRWVKTPETDLVPDNPRFSDTLATLSAALRDIDKDEIAGEHLKFRRLFRFSVATTVTLLIGLSVGLAFAVFQAKKETEFARIQEKRAEDATTQAIAERNQAEEQRNRAKAQLARAQRNESITLADQSLRETAIGDPIQGIQLALSALPADRSSPDRPFVPRAEFALAKAVSANRLEYAVTPSTDWVNQASFSPDGTEIALATRDGFLKILDAATAQEIRSSMEQRQALLNLAYSPDVNISPRLIRTLRQFKFVTR
jgi:WD40 repeat protein